jgi:anti-sigma regulatory factor (Ser/Thr protein kinase)
MGRSLEVVLENRLDEIRRLADDVDAFCREAGIAPKHAFNLNLALDELITNVILYGYEDGGHHQIRVALSANDDELTAELVDDGKPFDPIAESPEPRLEAPLEERPIGGLGLHLVRTLMDDVRYRRDGAYNRMSLVKRLDPTQPPA